MPHLKGSLSFYVPKATLPLLFAAVKHFERIPDKPEDKDATQSLLGKIAVGMAEDSESPYDPMLTLTGHEADNLDFALHMTMADAKLAKKYGRMADEPVGRVMLSSLADKVPDMMEVLRSLDTALQVAALEQRVSAVEERVGIVRKEESGEDRPSA